jgi:Ion channel
LSTPSNHSRSLLRLESSEFWSGDLGLTLITISLAAFIVVILPMHEGGLPGRFILDLVLLALMVSGALTVGTNRLLTAVAIVILLSAAIVLWVAIAYPTPFLQKLSSVLSILAFLLYVRIVLLVMFREGPVSWSRIQGGISAYMLLGLVWSRIYQLIELMHTGSFHFLSKPENIEQLSSKLVYFIFTTFTTVGFGDITPLAPLARSLAITEGLVGQLFPAILIGALVAMAMQARPKT